jgi:3'(2'), 5'-bisphosphate nucleotidase
VPTDDLILADIDQLKQIAREAGDAIMTVYESDDFSVEHKEDDSPLTRADKLANDIIVSRLKEISSYPIISEENAVRSADGPFWLVDPLDGTKEFIKQNGEFTVNIALVSEGSPVQGVVYVPAAKVGYTGDTIRGHAMKYDETGEIEIFAHEASSVPTIVTSKSHKDERTERLLEAIGEHREVSMGSSLKLCLVAEGKASLYPRLAPTYLWDTAAADAVVTAAGGAVKDLSGQPLHYDPAIDMKNPYFVAEAAANTIDWRSQLG